VPKRTASWLCRGLNMVRLVNGRRGREEMGERSGTRFERFRGKKGSKKHSKSSKSQDCSIPVEQLLPRASLPTPPSFDLFSWSSRSDRESRTAPRGLDQGFPPAAPEEQVGNLAYVAETESVEEENGIVSTDKYARSAGEDVQQRHLVVSLRE
jgi:hypothetical protein